MRERGAILDAVGGRARFVPNATACLKGALFGLFVSSSVIPHPSSLAWAAPPYITDDTGTQGKGNWQLELIGEYVRHDRTAEVGGGIVDQRREVTLFVPVLTYGLAETVDIALGLSRLGQRVKENGVEVESNSGMSDTAIEVKWRLYESNGLSFALKPGLILPTGDENEGLGTGKVSFAINTILTYEAKPWVWLANIAYVHARYASPQADVENHSHLGRASGGVGYYLWENLRLAGELGVRTNSAKDDPFLPGRNGHFAMAGVIYSPTDKIDLAVGFRRAYSSGEPDKALTAGATFRW